MTYTIVTVFFHLTIPFLLLRLSGEVGKLSMPFGYASLTRSFESGNLPFNLVFRTLYVPVALTVLVIGLYFLRWDFLIEHIWLLSVWYSLLQFFFLLNKLAYVRLHLYFLTAALSILLSYALYYYSFTHGLSAILPDAANFRTELWFIFGLFFYELFKNRSLGDDGDELGDKLRDKYLFLKGKYGHLLSKDFMDRKVLNDVFFAIMVYEDINRPQWLRFVERVLFRFGLVRTTGIMQVTHAALLTDEESILKAQERILAEYDVSKHLDTPWNEMDLIGKIVTAYNPDAYYRAEVRSLFYRIQSVSTFLEEGKYCLPTPNKQASQ